MTSPNLNPNSLSSLNSQNQSDVKRLLKNLPQSLALSALDYQWGLEIAQHLANNAGFDHQIIYPTKLEEINLEQGKIGVTEIRNLVKGARTLQKKSNIYILYKADSMTEQAQNALLKVYEEPNQSTYFILLVKNLNSLLPTIVSRSNHLNILPLSNEELSSHIDQSLPSATKNQILFIASGNPVAAKELSQNTDLIKQYSESIKVAKELINANSYQRLVILNNYKNKKEDALKMLEALIKILHTTIKNPDVKILNLLNGAVSAHQDIKANFNIRLALLYHLG